MTQSERAVQMWSVLALAARNRQVLTYDLLARLTGVPRMGLANCLDPIQSYCLRQNLPPLTVLVVQDDSGVPGERFIAEAPIPQLQQRVFQRDWLEHCPSSDDFEEALRQRPEQG
jgi:hypothetical protein